MSVRLRGFDCRFPDLRGLERRRNELFRRKPGLRQIETESRKIQNRGVRSLGGSRIRGLRFEIFVRRCGRCRIRRLRQREEAFRFVLSGRRNFARDRNGDRERQLSRILNRGRMIGPRSEIRFFHRRARRRLPVRRRASSPRVRGFLSVGRRQDVFRARACLRRFVRRYVFFSGDGGFPVVFADVLVLRRDLVAFLIRDCGHGFVFFGFRMEFGRLRSEKLSNPERAGQSFERVVKLFDRSRRNLRKRAVHGVLRHGHRRGRMDARFL